MVRLGLHHDTLRGGEFYTDPNTGTESPIDPSQSTQAQWAEIIKVDDIITHPNFTPFIEYYEMGFKKSMEIVKDVLGEMKEL